MSETDRLNRAAVERVDRDIRHKCGCVTRNIGTRLQHPVIICREHQMVMQKNKQQELAQRAALYLAGRATPPIILED